ncbi:MAG TPA: glycosyltransferase family 4 protein [Bacteroidota bacterium]|nr:glycosyltransferase family 4 protein [Bacteroidota bacterium]
MRSGAAQSSKILLLTDEMDPGGVARHVADLANGLEERGIRSIVAATDGPFRSRLHDQIPFVNLSLYTPGSGRKSLRGLLSAYSVLKKIIVSEKLSLVHSHKRYTDALGRVLARRTQIPHISTCHNFFTSLRYGSVFGDFTIACGKAVGDTLVERFGKSREKVRPINYGILPLRKYEENERGLVLKELGTPAKSTIVASVGQLFASKDRATLLRAIGILKKQGRIEHVVFVILGDGGEEGMLKALVRSEEIEDHILFLKGTYNVEALFNVSDFMVLSSIREGLPYTILEAASLAKPHIATEVGSVPEFILNGETGILVPPKNPAKLAAAIARLLERPDLAKELGKNAHEKFLNEYSYDRFIDQTIEVYRLFLPINRNDGK